MRWSRALHLVALWTVRIMVAAFTAMALRAGALGPLMLALLLIAGTVFAMWWAGE